MFFFFSFPLTWHFIDSWQVLSMQCVFPIYCHLCKPCSTRKACEIFTITLATSVGWIIGCSRLFFVGGSCIYIYASLAAVPLLYFCFVFVAFGSPPCVVLSFLLLLLWWFLESKGSIPSKMATTRSFVRTWPGFPTNSFVVVFGWRLNCLFLLKGFSQRCI